MTETAKAIIEIVKELPPEYQQEVKDFAEFLKRKNKTKLSKKPINLTWRGALKELKEKYTSVELQHKAHEWWGN